jgi:uncharacterized membrane protein
MRVSANTVIAAPPERVWDVICDPQRVLSFYSGVTRWEVEGDLERGLGARYRVLFRIGAAEIGGLIEMVEWDEPCEIAWTSVLGVDQRGRWRLRPMPGGRTRVELRMQYGVAGSGLFGWLAERVSGPTLSGHLRRTLQALKRLVEHEQLRARAAERRASRAA